MPLRVANARREPVRAVVQERDLRELNLNTVLTFTAVAIGVNREWS